MPTPCARISIVSRSRSRANQPSRSQPCRRSRCETKRFAAYILASNLSAPRTGAQSSGSSGCSFQRCFFQRTQFRKEPEEDTERRSWPQQKKRPRRLGHRLGFSEPSPGVLHSCRSERSCSLRSFKLKQHLQLERRFLTRASLIRDNSSCRSSRAEQRKTNAKVNAELAKVKIADHPPVRESPGSIQRSSLALSAATRAQVVDLRNERPISPACIWGSAV